MGKRKQDNTFIIKQFQPNDCVTSSSIMVEVDGIKILLDLGLMQDSSKTFGQLYHCNMEKLKSIPYKELSYCVLSHAHYDHSSAIAVLNKSETEFNGEIIMTELTASLSKIIMRNAYDINLIETNKNNNINTLKVEKGIKKNKKSNYELYYNKEDVENVMNKIRCYSYFREIKLTDRVTLELLPACHLSGASMIYLTYKDEYKTRRLLYTGDITYGHEIDRPYTMNIIKKCLKADVLICESTYGLRDKKIYTSENPIDFLENIIMEEVVGKNQTLWIPSFAVHRATCLYYYLNEIFKRNENIKKANIPVYFCGKMMRDAHDVIGKDKYNDYYDEQWRDKKEIFLKQPFGFLTEEQDVRHFCLNNTRKIVVSSAGMYDKGYSALLAKSYVANKKISTVACGYQGENTLGWFIREGYDFVEFNGEGRNVRLKYKGVIPELSGHANHEGLISFIKSLNQSVLKNIVLVHGDTQAKEELKEDLEKVLGKNKNVHIIKQYETLKF